MQHEVAGEATEVDRRGLEKSKINDLEDNCASSEASDLILHGQQTLEGLEYDEDIEIGTAVEVPLRKTSEKRRPSNLDLKSENQRGTPPAAEADGAQKATQSQQPATSLKLPSMTQVYELASNVGCCIEPLSKELGQNRLDPLTKSIIQMLNILENTVGQAQQLSKITHAQQLELSELRTRYDGQTQKYNELELDYHCTVTTLTEQLDALQTTQNRIVSDWSFEDTSQNTHVEENLAYALKQAHEKIEKLQGKSGRLSEDKLASKNGRNLSKDTGSTSGAGSDEELEKKSLPTPRAMEAGQMGELMAVLNEKNFYKQKCFALEDELRELRGGPISNLNTSESEEPAALPLTTSLSNTALHMTSQLKMPQQYISQQLVSGITGSQQQLKKRLSSYFNGFLDKSAVPQSSKQ